MSKCKNCANLCNDWCDKDHLPPQDEGVNYMNVTLGWFLSHIYSDRDGNTPLVWIYDWVDGFYPDDEGKKGTELLAVFQSDFIPQYTFKEKFCAKVVKEIYGAL